MLLLILIALVGFGLWTGAFGWEASYGPGPGVAGAPATGQVCSSARPGLVGIGRNAQGRERFLVDGVGSVLVSLPAGRFQMGSAVGEAGRFSDEARHRVVLSHGFLLGETPVTQADYAAVMGSNPSRMKGSGRPVDSVSWLEAVAYCNALSRRGGLEEAYVVNGADVTWKGLSCPGFRLPTEAEWEYACRAGTAGPCYGSLDAVAWYDGNSKFETHPVRWRQPNAWGLHDMLGNVWEWCWDCYGDRPSGPILDPLGPGSGSYRVNRGGAWRAGECCVRAACRSFWLFDSHNDDLGFRVARSLP